jgi:hypothetical protein
MTYEDFMKRAETDDKGQTLVGLFSRDQSINVTEGLSEIEGFPLNDEEYRASLDLTPTRTKEFLKASTNDYAIAMAQQVHENWNSVVRGFGTGDEGRQNLVSFLIGTKPVDGAGSAVLREKHGRAYDSGIFLRDPEARRARAREYEQGRIADFDEASSGLKGVVSFLYSSNPGLAESAVIRDAKEKINSFNEELGQVTGATDYLGAIHAMYGAQPDENAQLNFGVNIGRAVYGLEKARRAEADAE